MTLVVPPKFGSETYSFYLYHILGCKEHCANVSVSLKNGKRSSVPFADFVHFLRWDLYRADVD